MKNIMVFMTALVSRSFVMLLKSRDGACSSYVRFHKTQNRGMKELTDNIPSLFYCDIKRFIPLTLYKFEKTKHEN